MIATVKIAKVEMWCPYAKERAQHGIAGRMIGIDTKSMQTVGAPCGGRFWNATLESEKQIEQDLGIEQVHFSGPQICEHMLEMD